MKGLPVTTLSAEMSRVTTIYVVCPNNLSHVAVFDTLTPYKVRNVAAFEHAAMAITTHQTDNSPNQMPDYFFDLFSSPG
jgi:hypothetical protein